MTGEWIRFGLAALCVLGGCFALLTAIVGLFRFDLVAWLFGGSGSLISRILYTLVGLAGLWCITFFFRKAAFRDAA